MLLVVADDELPDLLKQIPDWQPITTDSVLKLNKVFNFDSYSEAISFTNKIAQMAEEEDHHPAICLSGEGLR